MQDTILTFHHRRAGSRAWQAGYDEIAILRHLFRAVGPFGTLVEKRLSSILVEVTDGQVMPVSKQAPRQFATRIAQSDKTDFHACSP